ncbi:N-acetylmuramoyl-L-alanine amidase [Yoonia sp. 208BN28-4]|uniref:N-acetylmuramoyl-L-alanine amidase n=1 Tax=Yoonia sp. 208BN28-4 TaxID=3126505 RepID=UPI00309D6E0E
MVVIHYTAMQSAKAACDTLCNPDNEVSAHYLIGEDGSLFNLVPEDQRAWHAGAGRWGDVTDINSRSIGIELANTGFAPFAAPLMDTLEAVLGDILQRHAIPVQRVIGHSDMAPGRKIDPGPRFDWRRLARSGLAIWPDPQDSAPPSDFRTLMQTVGYSADVEDDVLLSALRLRFRPRKTGQLDETDMAIITDLARRFPVDATAPTA